MWNYEKRLQYPVKITQPNAKLAQVIISQFGGPDGELAASMRYLSQRYTMPFHVAGLLTDIGSEAPEMFRQLTGRFQRLTLFLATVCPLDSFRPVDSLCCPQPYSSI